MQISGTNLKTLYTGFNASFKKGLGQHQSQYARVATRVPSTTGTEEYGWLGKIPSVREWIGERQVNKLGTHGYAIKNKDYEITVEVDRNDILDDKYGIYSPMFEEMGMSVSALPDQLIFDLMKNGFTGLCYDGQPFFDAEHPVIAADGSVSLVANTDAVAGSGAPWFLLDTKRALKPFIFQERQAFNLVSKTNVNDDNVFWHKSFIYGSDGRANVGYGFWQMAFGSKKTLDKAAYAAAREALMGMKGDQGRPLGITPNLLVVPPSLEGEALEILNAERDAAGATNVYKGTAELLVVPWLA